MPVLEIRTTDGPGYRAGDPGYRRVGIALFAAGVATFASLYSTQAVLPALSEAFHVTPAAGAWSLSTATIGLGLALLITGPLSERVGRTRLIHLSLTLAAGLGLACAVAPTWPLLLTLRLLQGAALAGLPAVATAYLREELHPATQARAAGLYIGGTALGGMAGRLTTGLVTGTYGWRSGLAAVAVLGLICAGVAGALLPPSRNFVPRRSRALSRRALSDPGLLSLYAIGACAMGAFVAVFNALGFRLTAAPFDLSPAAASAAFLVYPIGSVSSAVSGRLADRFGRRPVMTVGVLLTTAGLLLTLPGRLVLVMLGLAVLTAGFFCVHGLASGWVPVHAYNADVSAAQAASLYLVAYYAGSSIAGNVAGSAWSAGGWPPVVLLSAMLMVMAGLMTIRLKDAGIT